MKTKSTQLVLYAFVGSLLSCSQQIADTELEVKPEAAVTRSEEAFPLRQGALQTGRLNGVKITYSLIEGQAVFQRDMLISPDSITEPAELHTEGTGRSKAASRWPNKIVYYAVDPALPNQDRITSAIAHWESNTPIRFVPRTTQRGYVLFRSGPGCSSNVGYVGRIQYINLASNCTTGNTIHEIGHTLGLWHEQSRTDRDSYITVNTGNILPGYESDFQTYAERRLDGFDYTGGLDFGSIMMYGSYDFSSNGLPTMTRKDGSTFISQRQGLSALDINTIKSMYP